jgi:hypothetical protein
MNLNACAPQALSLGYFQKKSGWKSGGDTMTRDQLEHILRAAHDISEEYDFIIVGSQSVLGQFPNAPDSLVYSMEADIYPLRDPDKADLIDGSIGEYSRFHDTYGYYAQGVSPKTAVLPKGWESRLTRVVGENCAGYCISAGDLAVSKLVANRAKDLDFVKILLKEKMVDPNTLKELIAALPVSEQEPKRMDRVENTLGRLVRSLERGLER